MDGEVGRTRSGNGGAMEALSGQHKSATSESNPRSTVGYIFSGMVKG